MSVFYDFFLVGPVLMCFLIFLCLCGIYFSLFSEFIISCWFCCVFQAHISDVASITDNNNVGDFVVVSDFTVFAHFMFLFILVGLFRNDLYVFMLLSISTLVVFIPLSVLWHVWSSAFYYFFMLWWEKFFGICCFVVGCLFSCVFLILYFYRLFWFYYFGVLFLEWFLTIFWFCICCLL